MQRKGNGRHWEVSRKANGGSKRDSKGGSEEFGND